jgi:phosphoglycolate phosphatase
MLSFLMMLPSPAAILFDWDNTLVSSWGSIQYAINQTMAHFGEPLWTLDEVKARAHESAREAFPKLFGRRSDEALAIFYDIYQSQGQAHIHLFEGTLPLLRALTTHGIPLGVVSNKRFDNLRTEVEHFGLTSFLGVVVGANEAPSDKPAPDPIFLALKRLGIPPSTAVWFVGDTIVDYLAAKAAGCSSIMVGYPHQNFGDVWVDDIAAIKNCVFPT